jgi:hypothetical protein
VPHFGSLQAALHEEMDNGAPASTTLERQLGMVQGSLAAGADGGYPWSCGGIPAAKVWLTRFVANSKHSHVLSFDGHWVFENENKLQVLPKYLLACALRTAILS